MEIPVGFGQVNFRFTGTSAPLGAEVTCGFENSGLGVPATLAAAAGVNWVESFLTGQSNDITLESVLVKLGPNDTGPAAEVSVVEQGDSTGDSLPANCAVLVRKVTSLGGRAARGRFYVPGITDALIGDDSTMVSGAQAIWQGLADDFFDKMEADGMELVLLHGPTSPLSSPTPLDSLQVDAKVATQRRRLRR